jgi:hypothetical protein
MISTLSISPFLTSLSAVTLTYLNITIFITRRIVRSEPHFALPKHLVNMGKNMLLKRTLKILQRR